MIGFGQRFVRLGQNLEGRIARRITGRLYLEVVGAGLLHAALVTFPDDGRKAGVAQVQGNGAPHLTVADDAQALAFQHGQIGVRFAINDGHS